MSESDSEWRRNKWEELSRKGEWRDYVLPSRTDREYENEGLLESKRLARFIQAGDSVLDIGCGNCRVLKHIKKCCRLAVGIDYCFGFLTRCVDCKIVLADGCALPFVDDSFDFVYSVNTLLHLPLETQTLVVAEASRTARRQARLMLASTEGGYYRKTKWMNPVTFSEATEMARMTGKQFAVHESRLAGYAGQVDKSPEWEIVLLCRS